MNLSLEHIKSYLEIAALLGIPLMLKWLLKQGRLQYEHYKKNRDQWRVLLMEVQKEQTKKLDQVIYQLYPNTGGSVFDKVDKILDNQVVLKEVQDASLYLNEVPMIKSNMDGECTWVNLAYLKMCGFNDPAEAYGEGAIRSVHPDDRERVRKSYMAALRTGSQFMDTYRKINVQTLEEFPVNVMAKIIKDSKNNYSEVLAVIQKK